MKELFGLKDENGTEYKLILPDPVSVNTQVFAQAIPNENKPEFKAGQWVIKKSTNEIERIRNISGNDILYDNGCYHYEWKGHIRPATPDEIESHLRKICDEKYIGKKVECLCDERQHIVKSFDCYDKLKDIMWYNADDGENMIIYEQGKFASIIPDKKKLPKTREEFEKFLSEYTERRLIPFDDLNKDEFLDQYEI